MSYKNNTIEALKKLYVAMGGDADDVENLTITPEMISAIADIYQGGGGGSDLPAVTSDDNGKVLAVVEGDWDKADAKSEVVTVALGETSLSNAMTALANFLAAAVASAGTFTAYYMADGVSETDSIISYLNQGKVVILDCGDMGKIMVSGFATGQFNIYIDFYEYVMDGATINAMISANIQSDKIMLHGIATLAD